MINLIDQKIFSLFDESLLRSGFDASNPDEIHKRLERYKLGLQIVFPFALLMGFICIILSIGLVADLHILSPGTTAIFFICALVLITQFFILKNHLENLNTALFLHELKVKLSDVEASAES